MNKEIYINGMDWKKIKDNQGGLTLMITFKDYFSKEDYIELMKRNYYFLTTKEEFEDLQERIDKAIEYINDMCLFDDGYANYGDDLRPAHIVDILNGEDNE